MIRAAIYSAHV